MRLPRHIAHIILLIGALCMLGPAPPARASHVTVDCASANLSDLAAAVHANLGPSNGGFDEDSTIDSYMHSRDIYSGSCGYVNGFDLVHAYYLVDFMDPDGSRAAGTDLYMGIEAAGIIGDVDGDGSADTRTSNNPLCGGAVLQDTHGIGRDEWYVFRWQTCGSGVLEVRAANDTVVTTLDGTPISIPPNAQVSLVFAGHTLKLCIKNVEAFWPDFDISALQAYIQCGALYDYMGEEAVLPRQLALDELVDVANAPSETCAGGTVNYAITVRNPGPEVLHTLRVRDALFDGLTYISDDGGSTGTATVREWSYPNAHLPPGGSLTIHLSALAPDPCNGPLGDSVYVEGANLCAGGRAAVADTFVTVPCNACEGLSVPEADHGFALFANAPNPFNHGTTLRFALPEPSHVTLTVYSILGQRVTTLVDRDYAAGVQTVQWTAVDRAGQPLKPGLYYYRLHAAGASGRRFDRTLRMVAR